MSRYLLIFAVLSCVLFASCGEKTDDKPVPEKTEVKNQPVTKKTDEKAELADDAIDTTEVSLTQTVTKEESKENPETAEKKAPRDKKDENKKEVPQKYIEKVKALENHELVSLLPQSVSGCTPISPNLGSIREGGTSYLQASKAFSFSGGHFTIAIIDFVETKNLPEFLVKYMTTLPKPEPGIVFHQIKSGFYRGYSRNFKNKPGGKLLFAALDRFMIEISFNKLPKSISNELEFINFLDHSKFEKYKK